MKRFLLGLALGAVLMLALGAAPWGGRAKSAESSTSGLWADYCFYKVDDVYSFYDLRNLKFVYGLVGNWDGAYISDYAAHKALGDFDCQRVY